jgi:AcrR family transcriptional regulator
MNSEANTIEFNKEQLLKEATSMFVEHGYDGVEIDELAKTSDVSTDVIHEHFETKEDLYKACLEYEAGSFLEEYDRLVRLQ